MPGRVVAGDGRAEHAQRGVALELVDEAALGLDDVDHDAEELVEKAHDLGRRHRERHGGRAGEVDEERADLALLSAEAGGAVAKRGARDLLAHLPAEEVADALALPEPVRHPVDPRLEHPDL